MITREKLKFLRKHFGKNITPINPNTKKPTAVYQGNHYPDGKKNMNGVINGLTNSCSQQII